MNPLMTPARAPSNRIAMTAMPHGQPLVTMSATAAPPASPIMPPNERSKSCMTRTTVRPTAMISDGAASVRIDSALRQVGKASGRARLNASTLRANAPRSP